MYLRKSINEDNKFPFRDNEIKGIGRYKKIYNGKNYTYDFVFNGLSNEKWNSKEKNEYLNGNNGYSNHWTYDLNSFSMKDIVMEWIDEIPIEERTYRNVLRNIMYHMSSENGSNNSLIVGKWGDSLFEDGIPPSNWVNSSSIFDERKKNNGPIRYGQCRCFAECMTSICRFLGIACRTICGKNTLIDENLDNGIDFKEDIKKGETSNKYILMNKDLLNKSLRHLSLGEIDKGQPYDDLTIYDAGDSFWNVHFWNEVWIPNSDNEFGEWEIIDSTPICKSISNDKFNGMKILGPSRMSDFSSKKFSNSNENFDFNRLFSMVNCPYRLWTTEIITENEELVTIPFVYSIIYPHNERLSVYIKIPSVEKLLSFKASIKTRKPGIPATVDEDLILSYRSPSSKLSEFYFRSLCLDGDLYTQIVYLDIVGNVLKVDRKQFTLSQLEEYEKKNKVLGCYIISYLLIELSNHHIDNNTRWISFLKYNIG